MNTDRYDPVPIDVDAMRQRWCQDPAFKAAYDALEDEYAALDKRLSTRNSTRMTPTATTASTPPKVK